MRARGPAGCTGMGGHGEGGDDRVRELERRLIVEQPD